MPKDLPTRVIIFGKPLVAVGRGKFPYECKAKDQYPDAMIYRGEDGTGWIHEYDSTFLYRDESLDSYGEVG